MLENNETTNVVIIEYDYKGSYSRFALTLDEFRKEYIGRRSEIPEPTTSGESYTTRPLVHIWYKLCDVNSEEFNTFFTDMAWGLCQSDIECGNLAVIDLEECLSLRTFINDHYVATQKG